MTNSVNGFFEIILLPRDAFPHENVKCTQQQMIINPCPANDGLRSTNTTHSWVVFAGSLLWANTQSKFQATSNIS